MKKTCELCGTVGEHLADTEKSEIDLVGFMGGDIQDSVAPKWMCQSCYETFQAINPDAEPIMFQF